MPWHFSRRGINEIEVSLSSIKTGNEDVLIETAWK